MQLKGTNSKRSKGRVPQLPTLSSSCIVEMIKELPLIVQERISLLQNNRGKSLKQLDELVSLQSRELSISKALKKGADGKWAEHFILGHQGDTRPLPDLGTLEIKCVAVEEVGVRQYKPYENMRLTMVSYNEIQKQPFEGSPLQHKMIMLVVLTTRADKGEDKILLDVGYIDLRSYEEQVRKDYEYVQQVCKKGEANTLTSRQEQPCVMVKTYSSGATSKPQTYISSEGVLCKAKGMAFYLFKTEWVQCFVPLQVTGVEPHLPNNPIPEQLDERIIQSEVKVL